MHWELSKEELIGEGMNEKEAEWEVMERFGSEREIGCQLQQSIFPYRKELMLTLSVASFFLSVCTCFCCLLRRKYMLAGSFYLCLFIHCSLLSL
ncbi:permease prefix domain 1-containing protein [Bacillus badius]|uniref:permease prefix domain 1-containing protein n=1 Tax=Bacillus badius TaxID=1455 RepID=UPI00399D37B0